MKPLAAILETNYHRDRSKDHVEHLHDKLSKHSENFDEYQLDAARYYTGDSRTVNGYLWDRSKQIIPKNTSHENNISDIDSLTRAYKTPHKLSVYSGIGYHPKERMNENGIVHHPAFLSTSISQYQARNFGAHKPGDGPGKTVKHIMKINVPKGHHGAYLDPVSENQGEKEFLLPRGLNLKYKGTVVHKAEDTHWGMGHDIHEHQMEIV